MVRLRLRVRVMVLNRLATRVPSRVRRDAMDIPAGVVDVLLERDVR